MHRRRVLLGVLCRFDPRGMDAPTVFPPLGGTVHVPLYTPLLLLLRSRECDAPPACVETWTNLPCTIVNAAADAPGTLPLGCAWRRSSATSELALAEWRGVSLPLHSAAAYAPAAGAPGSAQQHRSEQRAAPHSAASSAPGSPSLAWPSLASFPSSPAASPAPGTPAASGSPRSDTGLPGSLQRTLWASLVFPTRAGAYEATARVASPSAGDGEWQWLGAFGQNAHVNVAERSGTAHVLLPAASPAFMQQLGGRMAVAAAWLDAPHLSSSIGLAFLDPQLLASYTAVGFSVAPRRSESAFGLVSPSASIASAVVASSAAAPRRLSTTSSPLAPAREGSGAASAPLWLCASRAPSRGSGAAWDAPRCPASIDAPALPVKGGVAATAYVVALVHSCIVEALSNAPLVFVRDGPGLPDPRASAAGAPAITRALAQLLVATPLIRNAPAFRARITARVLGWDVPAATALLEDVARLPTPIVAGAGAAFEAETDTDASYGAAIVEGLVLGGEGGLGEVVAGAAGAAASSGGVAGPASPLGAATDLLAFCARRDTLLHARQRALLALAWWASGVHSSHWGPASTTAPGASCGGDAAPAGAPASSGSLHMLALELFVSALQAASPLLVCDALVRHVLSTLCCSVPASPLRLFYGRAMRILCQKGAPLDAALAVRAPLVLSPAQWRRVCAAASVRASDSCVACSLHSAHALVPNASRLVLLAVRDALDEFVPHALDVFDRLRSAELLPGSPLPAGGDSSAATAQAGSSGEGDGGAVTGAAFVSTPAAAARHHRGVIRSGGYTPLLGGNEGSTSPTRCPLNDPLLARGVGEAASPFLTRSASYVAVAAADSSLPGRSSNNGPAAADQGYEGYSDAAPPLCSSPTAPSYFHSQGALPGIAMQRAPSNPSLEALSPHDAADAEALGSAARPPQRLPQPQRAAPLWEPLLGTSANDGSFDLALLCNICGEFLSESKAAAVTASAVAVAAAAEARAAAAAAARKLVRQGSQPLPGSAANRVRRARAQALAVSSAGGGSPPITLELDFSRDDAGRQEGHRCGDGGSGGSSGAVAPSFGAGGVDGSLAAASDVSSIDASLRPGSQDASPLQSALHSAASSPLPLAGAHSAALAAATSSPPVASLSPLGDAERDALPATPTLSIAASSAAILGAAWLPVARSAARALTRLPCVPDGSEGVTTEYRALLTLALALVHAAPLLRDAVLLGLLRSWPRHSSDNEVTLLDWVADVLDAMARGACGTDAASAVSTPPATAPPAALLAACSSGIAPPTVPRAFALALLPRLLHCMGSKHIKVIRGALLLTDPSRGLIDATILHAASLEPLRSLVATLQRVGSTHWSPLVASACTATREVYSERLDIALGSASSGEDGRGVDDGGDGVSDGAGSGACSELFVGLAAEAGELLPQAVSALEQLRSTPRAVDAALPAAPRVGPIMPLATDIAACSPIVRPPPLDMSCVESLNTPAVFPIDSPHHATLQEGAPTPAEAAATVDRVLAAMASAHARGALEDSALLASVADSLLVAPRDELPHVLAEASGAAAPTAADAAHEDVAHGGAAHNVAPHSATFSAAARPPLPTSRPLDSTHHVHAPLFSGASPLAFAGIDGPAYALPPRLLATLASAAAAAGCSASATPLSPSSAALRASDFRKSESAGSLTLTAASSASSLVAVGSAAEAFAVASARSSSSGSLADDASPLPSTPLAVNVSASGGGAGGVGSGGGAGSSSFCGGSAATTAPSAVTSSGMHASASATLPRRSSSSSTGSVGCDGIATSRTSPALTPALTGLVASSGSGNNIARPPMSPSSHSRPPTLLVPASPLQLSSSLPDGQSGSFSALPALASPAAAGFSPRLANLFAHAALDPAIAAASSAAQRSLAASSDSRPGTPKVGSELHLPHSGSDSSLHSASAAHGGMASPRRTPLRPGQGGSAPASPAHQAQPARVQASPSHSVRGASSSSGSNSVGSSSSAALAPTFEQPAADDVGLDLAAPGSESVFPSEAASPVESISGSTAPSTPPRAAIAPPAGQPAAPPPPRPPQGGLAALLAARKAAQV